MLQITKSGFSTCVLVFFILFLPFSLQAGGSSEPDGPPSPAESYAELFSESFDNGTDQWDVEQGWSVRRTGDGYLLEGRGHSWATAQPDFSGPNQLSCRIKIIKGTVHLIYRLGSEGRYFFGIHAGGSYAVKQYFPDTFIDLKKSSRRQPTDEWLDVTLRGNDSGIELWINGNKELTVQDEDALTKGRIAFESIEDSHIQVADVRVWGRPGTAVSDRKAAAEAEKTEGTETEQHYPGLEWERSGYPLGGLGYDIRMDPDNPDRLYVTDAYAGVFISTDGGKTWKPSNTGITTRTGMSGDSIPVFCLTIDPSHPETIWAGTQFQRGIFKSADRGKTWKEMINGIVESNGITFRGFAVDPEDSDIVYAAAELSSWVENGEPRQGREFDMTGGVVYCSSNGGRNWKAIWRGDNLARYVWIDPRDTDVIYISTGIFDREAANSDPGKGIPGGEGVVKSTDGGKTWQRMNKGLDNLYVGSLYMHPDNPDILLAGTGNNQYYRGNGVYLSTDGAESWRNTLSDDNITSVEFAETEPNIAYAASAQAIYRSSDGGVTWKRMSGGAQGWGPPAVRGGFPIDIQVDPRDPDRLFINAYGGGNFLSEDGGVTWMVASDGYTGAQVRDISVSADGSYVYASARSGIFRSSDNGESFDGISYPPSRVMEWNVACAHPEEDEVVLAADNWTSHLQISSKAGRNWTYHGPPMQDRKGWRCAAYAPSDPLIVYAGSSGYYSAGSFDNQMPAEGIYVSQDGGKKWRPANDSLSSDANIIDITISSADSSSVFAGTNKGLLFSSNGGRSWTYIDTGAGSGVPVLAVELGPVSPSTGSPVIILAGIQFGGIRKSGDGGESWKRISRGLPPEALISDILYDPVRPGTVYCSDLLSGVYISRDDGDSWAAVEPDGSRLYAATDGEGVYVLDLSGL
jgi:photosystem II stability/assembly factor-like uncharacterized protein